MRSVWGTAQVPEAEEYVIWVRHTVMRGAAGKGPFRLTVRQGALKVNASGGTVQVKLPLAGTDMLKLHW